MINQQELADKYGKLYEDEIMMETRYKQFGEQAVTLMYAKETTKDGDIMRTTLGQRFVSYQFQEVTEGIRLFFEAVLAPKRGVKPIYAALVQQINEVYGKDIQEAYNLIAMSALSSMLSTVLRKEYYVSNIAQHIAQEVYEEVQLYAYIQANPAKAESVLRGVDERVQASYKRIYAMTRMKHDSFFFASWSTEGNDALGIAILDIVVNVCPYFEYWHGETLEVRASQALLDAWSKNEVAMINNASRACPMVIPPAPWTGYDEGGYIGDLSFAYTMLRLHDVRTPYAKAYLRKLNQVDLENVLKSINSIQNTPWKINTQVLDVVQEIIDNGGGVAGIPYTQESPKPMVYREDFTEEEAKVFKSTMVAYYKAENSRKGIALRVLSTARIAREFRDYESIYFPHNLDFRGRVYPISTGGLSPQGDDLGKALLSFSKVAPLKNAEEIKWLYVAIANAAGVDKVSFSDRVAWVLDNKDNLLASASDPLGYRWWVDQGDALQLLAGCFEYEKLTQYVALHGTCVGFESTLPIAYDGTCSGLQHFSAILRDEVGGSFVNLLPSDKPSDIYAEVAYKVNQTLAIDARSGTEDELKEDKNGREYNSCGTKALALQWLAYGVNRKVCKRPVMTLAYGATKKGFENQIDEDTVYPDISLHGEASVFYASRYQAKKYLATLIWEAVSTTVVKAVEGMKWLQTCAKLVTQERQVVSWTTVMGLPVQQTYMVNKSTVVKLNIAGKRIRLYSTKHTGDINNSKQSSGVAPNFIHSQDACHLQMTVCMAADKGVSHFAMIHDSYGCSLAEAQTLYDTVREAFILMYTNNDVLENFKNDLSKLTTTALPVPPAKGKLDLNMIAQSEYIFS